jgi:hypothetical protein
VTEARVVLGGGGDPDAVVGLGGRLVAEDQDDLVLHVDGQAAEHRARGWLKAGERVEDEAVGSGLLTALRRREEDVVGRGAAHQMPAI